MANYQHLLIGLDLSDEGTAVIEKAKMLADACGARISLVHVVEPLTFAYASDLPVDLTETQQILMDQAHKRLAELEQAHGLNAVYRHVRLGQTASELRQSAEEIAADLLVIGSHGRHGLAILLGSTARDVLRGAACDVLAVKV